MHQKSKIRPPLVPTPVSNEEMRKIWDQADPQLKFGPVVPLFLQYLQFLVFVTLLICFMNIFSIYIGVRSYNQTSTLDQDILTTKSTNPLFEEESFGYADLDFSKLSQKSSHIFSSLLNGESKLNSPKPFGFISFINFATLISIYLLQIGYYRRRRRLGKKIKQFFNNKISTYTIMIKAKSHRLKLDSNSAKERMLLKVLKKIDKKTRHGTVEEESFVCNLKTSIHHIKYLLLKYESKYCKLLRLREIKLREIEHDKLKRKEIREELKEEDTEAQDLIREKTKLLSTKISIQRKLVSLEIATNTVLLDETQTHQNKKPQLEELRQQVAECRERLAVIPETQEIIETINQNLIVHEENLRKQAEKQGQMIKFKEEDCTILNSKIKYFQQKNKRLISRLWNRKDMYKKDKEAKKLFYAFITFESIEDKMHILKLHKKLGNKKFISWLGFGAKKGIGEFQLELIKLKPAPEPKMLNWKNVGIAPVVKKRSKLFGYALSILFNLFIFVLQTCLILFTFNIGKSLKDILQIVFGIFSVVRGFKIKKLDWWYVVFASLIEMLNETVSKFYKLITKRENHFSDKKKEISYASKIIIGRFFISEVTTFALFILPRIFSSLKKVGGVDEMNQYIFTMLVLNITAAPIFSYFRLDIITHNVRIFGINKKLKELKKPNKFFVNKEKALDKVLKEDNKNFGHKYCDILKTLCISCFYSWVLPIGPFMSLFTLLVQYWVDKRKLTRNIETADYQDKQISYVLSEYFIYIPVLYSGGNLLFPYIYLGEIQVLDVLGFSLSVFFCFFYSVRDLNRWLLFHNKKKKSNHGV